MNSREIILKRIRQNKPVFMPPVGETVPGYEHPSVNLKEAFKDSLILAGAEVLELNGAEAATLEARRRYPGAADLNDPKTRKAYHAGCLKTELDKIGAAVLEGQLGVAENGAIWLDESNFSNRLIPFIARTRIIKLNKVNLSADMHEAYRRIDAGKTGFGLFVSGPSKTADIEQSLVYGANGPKQLFVILY